MVDAPRIRPSTLSECARIGIHHHAVKLSKACLPILFAFTEARVNDFAAATAMPIGAGATHVLDKGDNELSFRAALAAAGCRCVTRRKVNAPLDLLQTRAARGEAIPTDRIGRLPGRLACNRRHPCPQPVRPITVRREDARSLDRLTKDRAADAREIAALDRACWRVELLSHWVKQNLKVKRFLGASEHAITLQILTALSAYLLLRLAQAELPEPASPHHLVRVVKDNLMHPQDPHRPPRIRRPRPPTPRHPRPNSKLALTHARA